MSYFSKYCQSKYLKFNFLNSKKFRNNFFNRHTQNFLKNNKKTNKSKNQLDLIKASNFQYLLNLVLKRQQNSSKNYCLLSVAIPLFLISSFKFLLNHSAN